MTTVENCTQCSITNIDTETYVPTTAYGQRNGRKANFIWGEYRSKKRKRYGLKDKNTLSDPTIYTQIYRK